jgi:two-component system chemotaxis sensor kinase CheA
MDKQKEAYREEAYELLSELETSLLELEERPDNTELVGSIFRALHTIKGSGAMFGFDDIAGFTHEIETVFDLVRDGKIPITRELVNLSLSAEDQIKAMLDGADQEESVRAGIVESFRKLIPPEITEIQEPEYHADQTDEFESKNITYRIRFHPPADIFANGTNPLLLLKEIRTLGDSSIVAQIDGIPALEGIEPETCYTSWDIILTTRKGINAIKDVFIFVEGDSEIHIEVIDEEGIEDEVNCKRLGEILVERGEVSNEDLIHALKGQKRIGEMLIEGKKIGRRAVESALAEQEHINKILTTRRENTSGSSIRVPAEKLDTLVDMVGELVTVQARLSQKASVDNDSELLAISEEVERLTAELRDNTMSIRMLPVGTIFTKFKRLVRDLCEELGKEAVLVIEGGETELDKTVIEQLNDPLVHIIRNTVGHGIEPPDVRESLGKPRQGTILLSAEHSGADVLIRVSGDGRGLDSQAIRDKAVEKGLISPDAELSEKEIFSLIFLPGFSTAKKVSGVSGRGVGMDVVKRTIESLRGSVDISSQKGKGTTTTLKLPLTLAIIDGLLVKIEDSHFVFPLSAVEECVELSHDALSDARRRNMMNFRDKLIPYLSLREIFMIQGKLAAIEQIIIVEAKDTRVGFGVDHVIGQYQTVIKSLGKMYRDVEGVSGATILGDGTVALILDISQLVENCLL